MMFQYDFSNHQNRYIRIEDMPEEYYKRIQKTTQEDPFYPKWHLAPKCGLMNDPNGLCQIGNRHHIFYQWFPAGPVHGLKHWYHVSTEDFIHYRNEGVGMYPDKACDQYGCFTGMALKDQTDVHIYYTGIETEEGIPCTCHALFCENEITDRQKILSLDRNLTTVNYRDPCVWKKGEEYFMIVGGETLRGKGVILFYRGKNPTEFQYEGTLQLGEYPFGNMLECPNYFEMNKKGILFFSPMGIQSENKYDFKNVFSVVYAVGNLLETKDRSFSYDTFYEMDKGFDFYAPQIYEDESQRRILFGWLGNSKSEYPTDKNNWAHMMTLPREIHVVEDRIVQSPVDELINLRKNASELQEWQALETNTFELECTVDETFEIEIGNSKDEKIVFEGTEKEYCLNREKMTYIYAERFGTKRYALRLETKQIIRIFVDSSSIEIFCDGGKTVFTSRVFIKDTSYLRVKGATGVLYELNPIQWCD